MALYPKKLNSLADLEKEKARLKKESKGFDVKELFVPGTQEKSTSSGNPKQESAGNILDNVEDILPLVMPLLEPLLGKFKTRFSNVSENATSFIKDKAKDVAISVAKEVIGGYLKWKAIDLSVKAVRHFLKKKDKKEE